MGQLTVFTEARTRGIEDNSITGGSIVGTKLILTRKNGTTVDAGIVKGDKGDTGLGLTATSLSTNSLNIATAIGVFYQDTNSNATIARNYPVPYAGVLEVLASSNITVQQYTVQNSGPYAGTTWIRSTTAATGVWSAWKCLNPPKYSGKSVVDTALPLVSPQTDLSGTAQTITVLDPTDVFSVTACVDVQSTGVTATTAILRLIVDTTSQPENALWNNNAIASARGSMMQQWLITGLSVGDHIFKLAALRSGGADAMVRINASHSTLLITKE